MEYACTRVMMSRASCSRFQYSSQGERESSSSYVRRRYKPEFLRNFELLSRRLYPASGFFNFAFRRKTLDRCFRGRDTLLNNATPRFLRIRGRISCYEITARMTGNTKESHLFPIISSSSPKCLFLSPKSLWTFQKRSKKFLSFLYKKISKIVSREHFLFTSSTASNDALVSLENLLFVFENLSFA